MVALFPNRISIHTARLGDARRLARELIPNARTHDGANGWWARGEVDGMSVWVSHDRDGRYTR